MSKSVYQIFFVFLFTFCLVQKEVNAEDKIIYCPKISSFFWLDKGWFESHVFWKRTKFPPKDWEYHRGIPLAETGWLAQCKISGYELTCFHERNGDVVVQNVNFSNMTFTLLGEHNEIRDECYESPYGK